MPASPPRILRIEASAIVTAGLKCAPQTPASEATSSDKHERVHESDHGPVGESERLAGRERHDHADEEHEKERAYELRNVGPTGLWLHGVSFQVWDRHLRAQHRMRAVSILSQT